MAENKEESSGDSTDVFSSKFDPLKAFYADGVKVPDTEAPLFDNISKFESFLKGLTSQTIDDEKQKGEDKRSTSRSFIRQDSTRSINVGRRKYISEKNVVNRMEKCFGPLSALYQYMENKIKVKVYTRSANGIRGYIEAYIIAFDTHWNIALEDCVEVWTRKIVRKAPAVGLFEKRNAVIKKIMIICLTRNGDGSKKIETNTSYNTVVKKKNKRMETVERHISQLLLRGEQIVSIVKMER